jgi:hypothetical protein
MNKLFSRIVIAGFIVGTLDILSAFIHYFIKTGQTHFFDVLKFIASGIFGKAAFSGGRRMILAGILIHYLIAFTFTLFFFWVFRKIKILSKNKIITGIIYGVFVWVVMNIIVLPFSNIAYRPFHIMNALINVVILIVCVGIPLSYMAYAFYLEPERQSAV